MALQPSGPISMDDMNIDRGIPSATQINLATAGTAYGVSYLTNGTNDLQFSEFYGLSVPSPTPPTPSPTPPTPSPTPPTPTPTPTVYYYNATRCHDNLSQIVYGGGNYYGTGTVVISGGTTYCYTIQNEVGVQAYDDTVGSSVDNCNNASCYVPPPPTPPPPTPTLTMSVSQGCVNYAGTGTINITGVSNGSGNYVYHIGGSIDFNDPNAYNLNSSASGLSNGNYDVAVYDSSTGVNVNETRNINCPAAPPPTPPPPTPPPTPPVCYTFNIINYNANETVTGTYTNCGGGSDSFTFTDTSGTSTNIGTICVLDGTTPTVTSGNGAASNSLVTC